jgi:hypothetical protein
MSRWLHLLCLIGVCASAALAQDPLKVAPEAYKLEFENEYVKVMRVHYAARAKVPEHDHTEFGAAYIYLNDAGPVIFKHIGLSYGAVTRPAVKAGSFRLYRAVKETHAVENPGDTSSDFLRVELKTEPAKEANTLRGRFFRAVYPAGENFQKVQFENDQVRITRLICDARKQCDLAASATEPSLLVALTAAQFKRKGKLEPGQTRWLAAGKQEQFENSGNTPAELLRFDFKTQPLKTSESDKSKPHTHPPQ